MPALPVSDGHPPRKVMMIYHEKIPDPFFTDPFFTLRKQYALGDAPFSSWEFNDPRMAFMADCRNWPWPCRPRCLPSSITTTKDLYQD